MSVRYFPVCPQHNGMICPGTYMDIFIRWFPRGYNSPPWWFKGSIQLYIQLNADVRQQFIKDILGAQTITMETRLESEFSLVRRIISQHLIHFSVFFITRIVPRSELRSELGRNQNKKITWELLSRNKTLFFRPAILLNRFNYKTY